MADRVLPAAARLSLPVLAAVLVTSAAVVLTPSLTAADSHDDGAQLEVWVVDASADPVTGAQVTVEPAGLTDETGDDGGVVFDGLEEGPAQVTATADGHFPDTVELDLPPDGTVDVELQVLGAEVVVTPLTLAEPVELQGTARVSGAVEVFAADEQASVEQVAFTALVDVDGELQEHELGVDDDGTGLGQGLGCADPPCTVDGVWSVDWEVPDDLVAAEATVAVAVEACHAGGCLIVDSPLYDDVLINPGHPDLEITSHDDLDVVDGVVALEVRVGDDDPDPDPDPDDEVELDWEALGLAPPRMLPLLDQRDHGRDADGQGGLMACAPTAAASSLAWLADEHDLDEMIPGDEDDDLDDRLKDLIDELGGEDLMDADEDGVLADWIRYGIEVYLHSQGLLDQFDVEMDVHPDLGDIHSELNRSDDRPDVMLGLYSHDDVPANQQVAHQVAAISSWSLPGGSKMIMFMDPWTGGIGLMVASEGEDGITEFVGYGEFPQDGGVIGEMTTVTPSGDDGGDEGGNAEHIAAQPASSSIASGTASDQLDLFTRRAQVTPELDPVALGDEEQVTWDTSDLPPGLYQVNVTATDAEGRTGRDSVVLVRAFDDVQGTTHEAGVGRVVGWQVAGGFADGTYRPTEGITRGQMATFLTRALQLPDGEPGSFDDTAGTTHEESIDAVASAGIAEGVEEGLFDPHGPVTRGQMATFLVRALEG